MNDATLRKAEQEAKRFLEAAKVMRAELPRDGYPIVGTRNSGAVRRASMDLTRALADLRRPA